MKGIDLERNIKKDSLKGKDGLYTDTKRINSEKGETKDILVKNDVLEDIDFAGDEAKDILIKNDVLEDSDLASDEAKDILVKHDVLEGIYLASDGVKDILLENNGPEDIDLARDDDIKEKKKPNSIYSASVQQV